MKIKVSDRWDELKDQLTCWLPYALDGFESDVEEIIRDSIAMFHCEIESGTYGEPECCETCGAMM